jgi:DNA polymerase I-like protein with 3'-5' exonuclease and polymerase domains
MDVPKAEAARVIDAYEAEFPCVRRYLDAHAESHSWGEPTHIYGVEGVQQRLCRKATEHCNTPFQGLVARGALAAVVDVTKASQGKPWWLSAFIHDELLCQGPKEQAEDIAREISEIMIAAMQRYIPDVPVGVDWHVGPLWEH